MAVNTSQSDKYANDSDFTLRPEQGTHQDLNDRTVNAALKILWNWQYIMSRKLRENDMITARLNDVTWATVRQQNCNLPPYLMHILQQKVRNNIKEPDFKLNSDTVSEEEKQLVTGLVVDVMADAGWQDMLNGKWGVFDKIVTYGDAFVRTYSFDIDGQQSEQDQCLFTYQNLQLARVFFNNTATLMRCKGSEGDANEVFLRFQMDYDEFMDVFPELYGKANIGQLPTQEYWPWLTAPETPEQQQLTKLRKIEFGYYYNKRKKIYAMIAGSNAYKVFEYKGKEYPYVFWDTQEAYIPVLHFKGWSKPSGIYGAGVCVIAYSLDALWQELHNRASAQGLDNLNPIRIINMPPSQRQNLFKKIEMATAIRDAGGSPLVINEIDPAVGGSAAGNMQLGALQTMATPVLTNEFERLLTQANLICGYLGVKIDDLMTPSADKPLGTTELELEAEGKTAKFLIDINESEFEIAVRMAMDAIARDIDDDDETHIRNSIKVMKEDHNGMPIMDPLTGLPKMERVKATRGAAAQCLREHRWRVEINTASGAVKNNVLQLSQISRLLADPNTAPMFRQQLMQERAKVMGFQMPQQDINPQMNANPQMAGQAPGQPTASGAQGGAATPPLQSMPS